MRYELIVENARIMTPGGEVQGTVAVSGGRIAAIVPGSPALDAATNIDAGGRHLLPGVVDVHVHFREPGQEYKATYRSESSAAAAGGVTTICDMPNNGRLAIVDAGRLEGKRAVAAASSYVDFGLYAFLVSADTGELRRLVEAGVMGFKWDMSFSGTEVSPGVLMPTPEQALPYFQAASAAGAIVGIHAEDRPLIAQRTEQLRAMGRQDARVHVEARPVEAEVLALEQAIDLARRSGARMHVHHLSSAAGLGLIRAAKREGLPITAETIPAFLFLDAGDYDRLGTLLKIHPAVKYAEDRAALWRACATGRWIALPRTTRRIRRRRNARISGGKSWAVGVQTSLPLMLTAVAEGQLSLARCVEVMSAVPARIYGLAPAKGAIEVGADADLVLVDLGARPYSQRGALLAQSSHPI